MILRKSSAAAKELGISYYRLFGLLRAAKLPAPAKDTSGDYIWSDHDLEAARQILVNEETRKAATKHVKASIQVLTGA
jgi:hypothetical protein